MTLDSPIVKMKMAGWQQELRDLTGNEVVMLTTFVIPDKKASWNNILHACYRATKIPKKEILGTSRKEGIVRARQLLSFFANAYAGMSHNKIAVKLNQERTNVRKNILTIRDLLRTGDFSACKTVARINAILFPISNSETHGQ